MTLLDTTSYPEVRGLSDKVLPPDLGDTVQIENLNAAPLMLMYDSRRYIVQPGEKRPVPFEAAKLWFGDPRAAGDVAAKRDEVGRVQWIPDRAAEVRRLRILYNVHPQNPKVSTSKYAVMYGNETQLPPDAIPMVAVYDYEGNEIQMVVHDPEGRAVLQVHQTVSESDQLRTLVAKQELAIKELQARMNADPTQAQHPTQAQTENIDEPSEADLSKPDIPEDDEPG